MLVRTRQFGLETIREQVRTKELDIIEDTFTRLHALCLEYKKELIHTRHADNYIKGLPKRAMDEFITHIETIEKQLFLRFGISYNIRLERTYGAYIYVFPIGDNHILLDKDYRGGAFWDFANVNEEIRKQKKIYDSIIDKIGTIDVNKAKVSGHFSEYRHLLSMDIAILTIEHGLTPRELMAVMLHEVGHSFTFYENCYKLKSGNHVIEEVFEQLLGSNYEKDKFNYYLLKLKDMDLLKEQDIKNLTTEDNRYILTYKVSSAISKNILEDLSVSKYDETSSEQLADNFSYKLGYGKELVVGLSKLYGGYNPDGYLTSSIMIITMLVESTFIFSMLYFLILSVAVTFIPLLAPFLIANAIPILLIGGLIITFRVAGSNNSDMTYDKLKIRYLRIRNQYVETIKKCGNDDSNLNNNLSTVYYLDDIINKLTVSRDLYTFIKDILLTNHKAAYRSMFEQQLIENLSANSLHLNNANLQVLIKGDK